MRAPENIILSRSDSIGDIVLAMPVAGLLKKHFPDIRIALLGRSYTKDITLACEHIDYFIDYEDFISKEVLIDGKKPQVIIHLITNSATAYRAKQIGIPVRIGTCTRLYHWFTCNRLVLLMRKKSPLHEAQLNLKLLKPLKISKPVSLTEIVNYFGLTRLQNLSPDYQTLIDPEKYNLIIHPKSRGNAREWPLEHFVSLINMLDEKQYKVFLSGVESELPYIQAIADKVKRNVTILAGKINLAQFISFINQSDAVVANSTGPVHVAAALGKDVIGIYPPLKPKDPGRWGPIGPNAHVMVLQKDCRDCQHTNDQCACIHAILPLEIKYKLDQLKQKKFASRETH